MCLLYSSTLLPVFKIRVSSFSSYWLSSSLLNSISFPHSTCFKMSQHLRKKIKVRRKNTKTQYRESQVWRLAPVFLTARSHGLAAAPPPKYAYGWELVVSGWSHVSSRPPASNIVLVEGTEGRRDVGIRLEFTILSVCSTWRKTHRLGKFSEDKYPSQFSGRGKLAVWPVSLRAASTEWLHACLKFLG